MNRPTRIDSLRADVRRAKAELRVSRTAESAFALHVCAVLGTHPIATGVAVVAGGLLLKRTGLRRLAAPVALAAASTVAKRAAQSAADRLLAP